MDDVELPESREEIRKSLSDFVIGSIPLRVSKESRNSADFSCLYLAEFQPLKTIPATERGSAISPSSYPARNYSSANTPAA